MATVLGIAVAGGSGEPAPPAWAASLPVLAMHKDIAGARCQVTNTVIGRHWVRLERLTSTIPNFPTERMRPSGRQRDPDIIAAFGTAMPPSRDVVLHYAPHWESGHGTPVLLVHGATVDGTCWTDPYRRPGDGLMQALAGRGLRVFAVTFAHRHGDNLLQAEQIANAIARIREVTGAARVDVVAHSKGTVSARAYASGMTAAGMTGYRGDIRRLVLVGGPHLGIDYAFRHPAVNWALLAEPDDSRLNAPLSWRKTLVMGHWRDTSAQSIYTDAGNYFPGQAQMLARLDRLHPLAHYEQDWYTTYHGGRGFASVSDGIDHAIAQGGHFMAKLAEHPLDAHVALAVLAGRHANRVGMLNETTGPSDGTVFVASATATDAMLHGGARLLDKTVLPLNHGELIYAPAAKAWLVEVLERPET